MADDKKTAEEFKGLTKGMVSGFKSLTESIKARAEADALAQAKDTQEVKDSFKEGRKLTQQLISQGIEASAANHQGRDETKRLLEAQKNAILKNNPALTILAPLKMLADGAKAGVKSAAAQVEDKRKNFRLQEALLNGITSVEKGVAGVAGAFGNAVKDKAEKFGGGLKSILKKLLIGGALAAFVAFMNSPYWEKMKAIISEKIVPALTYVFDNVIKPLWDEGLSFIFKQFETIGNLFSGIGDAITLFKEGKILEGITTLVGSLGTFFKDTIDNLFTAVYNLFGGLFGLEKTDSVFGSISNFFSDMWTSIKGFFTDLYDGVVGIFTDPVGTLNTMWTALTGEGGLVDILFKPIDKAIETVTGWFGITMPEDWSLTQTVKDALDKVFGWFETAFTDPKEALTQLWNGLVGEGGLVDFIFGPVDKAIEAITGWFGITLPESWSLTGLIKEKFTAAKDFFVNIFSWGVENSKDEEGNFSLSTLFNNAVAKIGDFFRSLLDIDVRGLAEGILPETVVDFLFGKKVDQESAEFKAMSGLDQAKATGLYDHDRIGNSEINRNLIAGASEKQLQAILDHDDLSKEDRDFVKAEMAKRSGAGEFSGTGKPAELNAYQKKMQKIEAKKAKIQGDDINKSSAEAAAEKERAQQVVMAIQQHPREAAAANRQTPVALPIPTKDFSSSAGQTAAVTQ